MQRKIIILGPAYPYRGGIAAFNERLAREFIAKGHEVEIVTYRVQYPSFLFPGKTQFSPDPAPEGLNISRKLHSMNPLNWIKTGLELRHRKADLIIVAFWLPYMAPSLGTVARLSRTRVAGLVHNLVPHEHRPGDRLFAKYFCAGADSFITLSESVEQDIHRFAPGKPLTRCPHPVYDNFGESVTKDEACACLGIDPKRKILLSFGLIRDYKGLDWLLEAFASIKDRSNVALVVAGEFYSDPQKYHSLAESLGIDDEVVWRTDFVPDSQVKYYFCAADLVVQPYKSATQSGITQIAYHFEKPMLVTEVGGLSEIVPDGKAGYTVSPSAEGVARGIERFLAETKDFTEGLREEKKKYSWNTFADKILSIN